MKCLHCGKEVSGEDNVCPFCGEKVKGKPTVSKDNADSHDYTKKGASVLTAIGNLFLFIGRVFHQLKQEQPLRVFQKLPSALPLSPPVLSRRIAPKLTSRQISAATELHIFI